MTNDAPTTVELRRGLARRDSQGEALGARKHAMPNSLAPSLPTSPRADPANPLLNPATSTRHTAEDAAPTQPNELPSDPDGSLTGADSCSEQHPLGARERTG